MRSMFYLLVRGGFYQPIIVTCNNIKVKDNGNVKDNVKTTLVDNNKGNSDEKAPPSKSKRKSTSSSNMKKNTRKAPKMIQFHRPFRKLAKSAAFVSIGISLLHAHCWSRTLSIFIVKKEDNAGAICRAVFSPFVGSSASADDYYLGADEQCIWIIWGIAMLIMIGVFFQDEKNGLHCRDGDGGGAGNNGYGFTMRFRNKNNAISKRFSVDGSVSGSRTRKKSMSITDDDIDYSSDENSVISMSMVEPPASASASTLLTKTGFFRNKKTIQEPVDTLPMVPWLSLFATRGGQLSALQWARENGCDWGEYTFAAAQICGIKDVLNYVIDECPRGVYNQHS